MEFEISKISGIGGFIVKKDKKDGDNRALYFCGDEEVRGAKEKVHEGGESNLDESKKTEKAGKAGKVFLVVNKNTVELRTDEKLRETLVEKFESVMESRYFGRGGIEIVLAGRQLTKEELEDLVRLSYNLSK